MFNLGPMQAVTLVLVLLCGGLLEIGARLVGMRASFFRVAQ